ncbi:MAG: hypothetical protein WCP74_02760 [Sphingobacteriia bacterium]
MEPGVREYLIRILNTIAVGLLWMAINSTIGIMHDYAFIHDRISTGNIVFYIWFIVSLSLFLWWVIRLWSKPIHFEDL